MSLKNYLQNKNLINNKIYVIALGLHSYGGLKVLNYSIAELQNFDIFFFIDSRAKNKIKNLSKHHTYKYISNNFINRLIIDLKSKFLLRKSYFKIYLNGIPPLTSCSNSICLFQNFNLIESNNFFDFKKFYFSIFKYNIKEWLIFNKGIKENFKKLFNKKIKISIIDFKIYDMPRINNNLKKKYDFFYPASGNIHKNHYFLFNLLIELSKEKIFPKVLITLTKDEYKSMKIEKIVHKYNLRIDNILIYNDRELSIAYTISKCLIFPSFKETLGIPLYEANYFECKILCSNKVACKIPNIKFFNPNSVFELKNFIMKNPKRYLL